MTKNDWWNVGFMFSSTRKLGSLNPKTPFGMSNEYNHVKQTKNRKCREVNARVSKFSSFYQSCSQG